MSRLLAAELNEDLLTRLGGKDLQLNADKVILIATVDYAGRPHPAMLSYFEVVARDRSNIRFATYKDSSTTGNMLHTGKATMSIIDERVAYYVKGSVTKLETQMRCAPHNAKLNLRVEEVLADEANEEFEPGAYVASGVTYRSLNRMDQLVKAREVIAELLQD
ncbi:MAG: pyridoxamine 5'-phosphate oxidase family protein [Pyrinomonadaceae bacterium]